MPLHRFRKGPSRSFQHHLLLSAWVCHAGFFLYWGYWDVDMSHPVKVLLRTYLWLNTSRSVISKQHPGNILDGIIWLSSCWPKIFFSDIYSFSELHLQYQVLRIFPSLPSFLLHFPEGKARTLNSVICTIKFLLESQSGLLFFFLLVELEFSLHQIFFSIY